MFEEEAKNTGRELAISWVNFHYDPAVKITRQGLEGAYRAGHKDGAKFGYNEALKEVDDICTEEAIYHARLEELFDRINWDGPEVKESEDEKLLKAIKDYAAHGHKDATPLDVALCIEQAIDNKEKNVKYKEICADMKADMCGTDNEVLWDYLSRLLRKYGEIV